MRNPKPHFAQPFGAERKPDGAIGCGGAVPAVGADEVMGHESPRRKGRGSAACMRRRTGGRDGQNNADSPGALEPQMLVGAGGRCAASRRAPQQPALQQVGLVDVLDRVGLLADRDGECRQARRGRRRRSCRARRECRGPAGPGPRDRPRAGSAPRRPRRPSPRRSPAPRPSRGRAAAAGWPRAACRGCARRSRGRRRASMRTPRMSAERWTIRARSAGSYVSRRCWIPKRSRSGVESRPARVVAPTSVNGGRSSVTTRAPAPWPIVIGRRAVLHRRVEASPRARGSAGGSRRRRRPPAARAR